MNPHIEGVLVATIVGLIAFGIMTSEPVKPIALETQESVSLIAVIGQPSQKLLAVINGSDFLVIAQNQTSLERLKGSSVAILQGDPYFDMSAREAIGQYVEKGGNIIVIGDTGSKHPEYANVAGWQWPAGQGIPVPAELVGWRQGYSDVAMGLRLRALVGHPVVQGMERGNITRVFKTVSKGETIIAVDTDEGAVPAVIEGRGGQGKVIYFAYDPGETPKILLNTLRYLK
jgi:hypothetical protein